MCRWDRRGGVSSSDDYVFCERKSENVVLHEEQQQAAMQEPEGSGDGSEDGSGRGGGLLPPAEAAPRALALKAAQGGRGHVQACGDESERNHDL